MNNYQKDIKNEDGTEETIVITSTDTHTIDLSKTYKLANQRKESKLARKFKNSVFGADIGFKSAGFSNIAILATLIAIGTLSIMYFLWRF